MPPTFSCPLAGGCAGAAATGPLCTGTGTRTGAGGWCGGGVRGVRSLRLRRATGPLRPHRRRLPAWRHEVNAVVQAVVVALSGATWLALLARTVMVAARMHQIEEYEAGRLFWWGRTRAWLLHRSEEHTSELQS